MSLQTGIANATVDDLAGSGIGQDTSLHVPDTYATLKPARKKA